MNSLKREQSERFLPLRARGICFAPPKTLHTESGVWQRAEIVQKMVSFADTAERIKSETAKRPIIFGGIGGLNR